jgi:hypothetical protein
VGSVRECVGQSVGKCEGVSGSMEWGGGEYVHCNCNWVLDI